MERVPTIRIGKHFRFESAHALSNYDGPCANIHGHSYVLTLVLSGKPRFGHPEIPDGMVMDFKQLTSLVNEHVIKPLDHKLVLHKDHPDATHLAQKQDVLLLGFSPTCEMLVTYIHEKLVRALPDAVRLEKIVLYETATSFAEWNRCENV